MAGLDFFSEAVEFARENEIVIVHDAPYTDLTFDGYRAHSILEVPGAKDVAIEFNSLSKTYNMAGWRIGMAFGNAEVIRCWQLTRARLITPSLRPSWTLARWR